MCEDVPRTQLEEGLHRKELNFMMNFELCVLGAIFLFDMDITLGQR